MSTPSAAQPRDFHITVLGRTLEHLGTQMYKRRDVAIAELVANCWDAGATQVAITVPMPQQYDPATSAMTVTDDGSGMTADQVDDDYLVIGRNRRAAGQSPPSGRKVMGRKGVGKLAGFGLARKMQLTTWRGGTATTFELDGAALKADRGTAEQLTVPGTVEAVAPDVPHPSGTTVTMRTLKHKTPVDIDGLHRALARRFSRTVLGSMAVTVNGEPLREPVLDLQSREPAEGATTEDIGGGRTVTWWAGFSSKVLPPELQGFTVLVHDKTAQAPPYFFGVEGTASGQHGTKYLTGVIEADYLDDGTDDDSDRISTDRQEIDWDDEDAAALKTWGDRLTRRLLRSRVEKREQDAERQVDDDPALKERIGALDPTSAAQVRRFVRALGAADTADERVRPLADTIIRAYEYRQFHDFIEELDDAAENPEQLELALTYLRGWKVLESRAILEVVKGRLDIVDKFHSMIVNDSAETAPARGSENLHDLIADYPWLINPDWQVLAEEKTLTKQLREWGARDTAPEDRSRYDFLALEGGGDTVVIEIKRAGHPVELKDLQQIERYVDRLGQARDTTRGAFITSERYALSSRTLDDWMNRDNIELLTWAQLHERTRAYYQHYRAVLEGDIDDPHFDRKRREVARTRSVLTGGAYRTIGMRAQGLGPQDIAPA
ncbi:ATP-binding protein [Pseudokineococcus basanitobsidens]|uniref:ATP-binding protein n=1 Tax=Pseudokineococcus basanitobsidens TaxID=1926649 RepID=A0ABU8RNL4_9ACTN